MEGWKDCKTRIDELTEGISLSRSFICTDFRGRMWLCFKHIQGNTYHTVVGKDLDIIHRAAQVLRDLPPDTSNRVITVCLQNMHKRAGAHTHTHTHQLCSLQLQLFIAAYMMPTQSLSSPLK